MSIGSAIASLVRRDGWQNVLTGLGGTADKASATAFNGTKALKPELLEELFHGDDMARRIVSRLVQDAMRQGFNIAVKDMKPADAQEANAALHAELRELKAQEAVQQAAIWGRLYGGGAVYMGVDDGQDPIEPLNEDRVRSLDFLNVLDRRQLVIETYYAEPTEPKYGEPKLYRIENTFTDTQGERFSVNATIHETRMLVFGGILTSDLKRQENEGWDFSVLDPAYEALQTFNSNWLSTKNLMTDLAQASLKVKGLFDMLAGGEKDVLTTRVQLMNMSRSVARMILLDSDGEEFERHQTPISGVEGVLDRTALRLAAAAEMPVSLLMGQAPAGMNATGESDIALWDDHVQDYQETELRERLERLITIQLLVLDGPTSGIEPDSWDIVFNALRQMTEEQTATVRKTVADADKIYIETGTVLPEEVALSRFTEDGWSMETNIDRDTREQILAIELERDLEEAKDPPEPPPMLVPGEGGTTPEDAPTPDVPEDE